MTAARRQRNLWALSGVLFAAFSAVGHALGRRRETGVGP